MRLQKILFSALFALTALVSSAQWTPTNTRLRYPGYAFQYKDTADFTGSADTALLIRQGKDSTLYAKIKGFWRKVPTTESGDFIKNQFGTNLTVENAKFYINDTGWAAKLLRSNKGLIDSIQASSSAGGYLVTNGGAAVMHWGGGGSVEVDFKGFAGYDANRSSSYTARSFTDKGYVDSSFLAYTTLQNAYNNSSIPNITTNTTNRAVSIQRGTGADTDSVFVVRNGAGTVTSAITGDGAVRASVPSGYASNVGSSYTNRSWTDKGYVDSTVALRLRIVDTTSMLANYPLVNGTRATGLWNISITGNAQSATQLNVNSFSAGTGAIAVASALANGIQNIVYNSSLTYNASVSTLFAPNGIFSSTLTVPTAYISSILYPQDVSLAKGLSFINGGQPSVFANSTAMYVERSGVTTDLIVRTDTSASPFTLRKYLRFNNSTTNTYTFPNNTGTIALTTDTSFSTVTFDRVLANGNTTGRTFTAGGATLTGALSGTSGTFSSKLEASEASNTALRLNRVTSGNSVDINFYNPITTAGDVARIRMDGDGISNAFGALSFWTTQTPNSLVERLRITSSGNVGIGTTLADNKLIVENAAAGGAAWTNNAISVVRDFGSTTRAQNGDLIGKITIEGRWAGGITDAGAQIRAFAVSSGNNYPATDMAFFTSAANAVATEKMRLISAGRLLVNTTTDDGSSIIQANGNVLVSGSGTRQIKIKGSSVTGFDLQNDSGGAYLTNRDATPMYFFTNNTQRLEINGSTGAATFSSSVTATNFRTGGTTTSVNNATATTLFTIPSAGMYQVFAYINTAGSANYTAFATVVSEGSDARIVSNNGGLLSLSISGLNVQVTQNSGVTGNVIWSYIKIN